jgi:hypothetical protein
MASKLLIEAFPHSQDPTETLADSKSRSAAVSHRNCGVLSFGRQHRSGVGSASIQNDSALSQGPARLPCASVSVR